MILFFGNPNEKVFAVQINSQYQSNNQDKLEWLFGNQGLISNSVVEGNFIGPRSNMITPWSTNAVEITQNMGIDGIVRIEEFFPETADWIFDPMLQQKFSSLHQDIFQIKIQPAPIQYIDDIAAYNQQEGLALSAEEVDYLNNLALQLGRKLTDSEVFGFSQVNSEHCRHKIFNGTFVIDGVEKPVSLFKLIKQTSAEHPNGIVSAYKDNVAFVKGPEIEQFAPNKSDEPGVYETKKIKSVISLKAETHNFPTTVEPFNGAATGSGGEIRDRMAGGKGSIPLAGTAVYMTSYSRLKEDRVWEKGMAERKWLYQTPMDILIKASNGASDFGNKFGQPLICGSVLTFEHEENNRKLGYDKVIMQAGGIGFGVESESIKASPKKGDKVVVLGGENYRIGMGGAAVSSADTGEFSNVIELNAVQRSNPEMQKRALNAIRALIESGNNPIVSIHDHGAGGHLNCLSELVEETGGKIYLDALPVGDPTLSAKEIIGNESQERMGLVIQEKDIEQLNKIAQRERAPLYTVGDVTGDHRFTFENRLNGDKPMDLALGDMFGSSPKMFMHDQTIESNYKDADYSAVDVYQATQNVLRLESVAAKDWLTNKVDRCVTGKVAKQQCTGALQLPLNNCGVMALDYNGKEGIATSIGHSPISALIEPDAGSRNAIAESLSNIIFAPLDNGLKAVSLSANWMWPCKNKGEDTRLYKAVEAASQFAISLGINIPTGKDSLSMKQKYPNEEVISPGTVVISAVGHCVDIQKVVEPNLQVGVSNKIIYINLSQDEFKLGGTAFAQTLNVVGRECADVKDSHFFAKVFNVVQNLILNDKILAGHDIGSGGLITTLLEMCFANPNTGAKINLSALGANSIQEVLFAENIGLVLQVAANSGAEEELKNNGIEFFVLGEAIENEDLNVDFNHESLVFNIGAYRDIWMETSYLLDKKQTEKTQAEARFKNYKNIPLQFTFPQNFTGVKPSFSGAKPVAAIIREKGSNSEREMANALFLAGFEVKDVHMTDLISGRETLEEVQMIAAVGGFSNSDVLGSAKGWAGAFLYNEKAKTALQNFFARKDTLSLGVCNGCQLFVELGLICPNHTQQPKMQHNNSGKFECVFTSITIPSNNSVMLHNLAGATLGIWSAHGEGKFNLPLSENNYQIVGKYGYDMFPANPNGSDYNAAAIASEDGRHLVMMPHLERSIFPWNWAYYPKNQRNEVTPWLQAFVNAKEWCVNNRKS